MALTRKLLRSMGIEDEKIDQIIDAHTETVNALKDERDGLKDAADRLKKAEVELEELKAKPADGFKEKFEKEHADFEAFKADTAKAAADREKKSLYRKLLTDAGVDPKRMDAVMRVADLSDIVVEDGAIKDADKVTEKVKGEWSDFIPTTNKKPANVDTPPAGGGDGAAEPKSLGDALRQKYTKQNTD